MVRCPSCGSGTVKKSSAIYEQGISHTYGRSGGYWVSGRGRIGAWSGRSTRTRITSLAQRNAPPANAAPVGAFMLVFLSCLLLGFIVEAPGTLIVIGLFLGIAAAIVAHEHTREAFEARERNYAARWYCSRCGSYFNVRDAWASSARVPLSAVQEPLADKSRATARPEQLPQLPSPPARMQRSNFGNVAFIAKIDPFPECAKWKVVTFRRPAPYSYYDAKPGDQIFLWFSESNGGQGLA